MTQLTCFKAYDIRGELGEELNEDIAYRIGRAYGEFGVAACVSDVLLVALLSCTVPFTVSEAAGTSVIWLHGCV